MVASTYSWFDLDSPESINTQTSCKMWYPGSTLCLGKIGYGGYMTKLLEKALEAVRRLPPDSQDEIARAMLSLTGAQVEPEEIDPEHLSDVLEGLAQAKRRQFATDVEIESAFRRFDQ